MTGVVKSVGKYGLLAGTALALSISTASAASMAKAGMDKRVADLEREVTLLKNQTKSAMMAKPADKNIESGNSRVKVTIYGQVNKALRITSSAGETAIQTVDNDGSSSRIGIRAVGKADPNVTIGGWHELEWQQNLRSGTNQSGPTEERVRSRHVDLWVDHKNLGRVWIGHGSIAGDAAGLYELTGVSFVYGFAGPDGADGVDADASVRMGDLGDDGATGGDDAIDSDSVFTESRRGVPRGYRPFNFFGARENRIRYDTPSMMGARFGISYNEKKSWSVGLTYAGAPPGVKNFTALFAAGYRKNDDDTSAWAVSGGIKHSSGFNVSGSYDTDGEADANGVKESQWGVSFGWTGKINEMGATALGLGYNRSSDGVEASTRQYWFAVVQNVDAAAADVYAGVSYDSGSYTHTVTDDEANELYWSACYTQDAGTGNVTIGAAGDTCAVERDGVYNFLLGVRVKF